MRAKRTYAKRRGEQRIEAEMRVERDYGYNARLHPWCHVSERLYLQQM